MQQTWMILLCISAAACVSSDETDAVEALTGSPATITNGQNHDGSILFASQVDSWCFSATAGDAISLSLAELTDTGSFTPWIRLRAPDGTQLGTRWHSAVAQVDVLSAPQTGLYTVLIGSGDSVHVGTGTYRLTLAQTPGSFVVPSGDDGGPMTNGANPSM